MKRKILCITLGILLMVPAFPQSLIEHPWKGKRVAYFGDSITDPRNQGSKDKYWNFLQRWLGITPYVYGISGRQWNDIPNQANKLKAEHGDDFDAIMIFMGTNDFNAGVKVGQWFNETDTQVLAARGKIALSLQNRKKLTPIMDDSTLCGRINIAMSTLKKMFPTKQIVILTPIHRAFFKSGNGNVQPTEEYTNWCGEYFSTYVQKIKEASNIWSVPVIDLNALCGMYPLYDEGAQYYHDASTDRLHPNDKGHERIARTLMYQLLTLPCVF